MKSEQEMREEEEQEVREVEAEAQGWHESEVKAQVGHEEGEKTTREECVEEKQENANLMHEESRVSNRHMTWLQNAWWVGVNNGPHLRTARNGRTVWRAAAKAAQEVLAGKGRRVRKGETGARGNREKRKQHLARRLPLSQCHHCNNRSSRSRNCSDSTLAMMHTTSTGMVDNETFHDIGHRNVDFMDGVSEFADLTQVFAAICMR